MARAATGMTCEPDLLRPSAVAARLSISRPELHELGQASELFRPARVSLGVKLRGRAVGAGLALYPARQVELMVAALGGIVDWDTAALAWKVERDHARRRALGCPAEAEV